MRFFNPKKIEFLIKNFFGFSDAFLLKEEPIDIYVKIPKERSEY